MRATAFTDVFTHFENLTDPRVERTRLHALPEMMAIALCAAICGAEGWADVERFGNAKRDWFARFLKLEHGIPSHDTFGRVFARLDTAQFFACLQSWLEALRVSFREQGIAIDGKTLRRSFDAASGKSAVHLVSAWASDLRLSLGQVAVDDKSNEITAVPRLLELLELAGAVVTLDALHCQKETAAAIRARGADYVLTVKRNQPTLYERLSEWFIEAGNRDYRDVRRHVTVERNRGRTERREYYARIGPRQV
jgi:predicted transposase YbfD/YdcC